MKTREINSEGLSRSRKNEQNANENLPGAKGTPKYSSYICQPLPCNPFLPARLTHLRPDDVPSITLNDAGKRHNNNTRLPFIGLWSSAHKFYVRSI